MRLLSLAMVASMAATSAFAVQTQEISQAELDAPAPHRTCLSPDRFPDSLHLQGPELDAFRNDPHMSFGLPKEVDEVVLLRSGPIAIAFIHGCAVGMGTLQPKTPAQRIDDGSI